MVEIFYHSIISQACILNIDRHSKNFITCDWYISRYLKAAKIGDNILVKAATDKVGKNLAFLNVQIVNKQSGAILAQGPFL